MGFDKDIIRTVGGVPSYYMRYFMYHRESLEKMKAAKTTRGEDCMVIEEELLEMYSDAGLYVKPEKLSQRGGAMYSECACSLAESLYTGDGAVHVVNTYNKGAISYMADNDVVETLAVVDKNGARTIKATEPGGAYIRGIVRALKEYENLTVKAAIEGCRTEAIRALMVNPLIGDYEAAISCFDEMLEAHKEYLPQFF